MGHNQLTFKFREISLDILGHFEWRHEIDDSSRKCEANVTNFVVSTGPTDGLALLSAMISADEVQIRFGARLCRAYTHTSGPCDNSRDGAVNMSPCITLTLIGQYIARKQVRKQAINRSGFDCVWLLGRKVTSWWRHQMESISALLDLCVGNSSVTGEFPSQMPVTRSFDVFFDLRLKIRLSKQSLRRLFETPSRSSSRHCNVPPTGKDFHYRQ